MNGSLRLPGDVFSELDQLQQPFEQLFRPLTDNTNIRAVGRAFPAVNVGVTSDSVEVLAFAPGIDAGKLHVTIDRGILVLAGERKVEPLGNERERVNVYAQERFGGEFHRAVALPEDADPTKVEATYRDGFLRISVAKRESSKPRRIVVN